MAAFALQYHSGAIVTETTWPTSLKYLLQALYRKSLLTPAINDYKLNWTMYAKGIGEEKNETNIKIYT